MELLSNFYTHTKNPFALNTLSFLISTHHQTRVQSLGEFQVSQQHWMTIIILSFNHSSTIKIYVFLCLQLFSWNTCGSIQVCYIQHTKGAFHSSLNVHMTAVTLGQTSAQRSIQGNGFSAALTTYCFNRNWHVSVLEGTNSDCFRARCSTFRHTLQKYNWLLSTHMQKADNSHSLTIPVHH